MEVVSSITAESQQVMALLSSFVMYYTKQWIKQLL